MGRQAFYRRWRSQTLAEIVGQGWITHTLRNALRSGRLVHAYLFCGPRGVGKTSMARILAKAANCQQPQDGEPCNACTSCISITEGRCLDMIEIDAASRRGIDDVRDLREKVNFTPTEVKYKFYILDEAHMLTPEAFNALLKTLEEPPAHTIFVLVTTEPHKLPLTVISRCQRFDFRRISLAEIVKKLDLVGQREGIEVEAEALDYIGRLSTGSLRDAESLLDQLVSYCESRITLVQVREVLGAASSQASRDLALMVANRDLAGGLRLINQVAADGLDLRQFSREVVDYLRGVMLVRIAGEATGLLDVPPDVMASMRHLAQNLSPEQIVALVRILAQAEGVFRGAVPPQLPLEMAFVEATLFLGGPVCLSNPVEPKELAEEARPLAAMSWERLEKEWPKVVASLGGTSIRLQALLRASRPMRVEDSVVVLGFDYAFHQEQVQEPQRRALVEEALSQRLGGSCTIRCILLSKADRAQQHSAMEDPMVKAALAAGGRVKKLETTANPP